MNTFYQAWSTNRHVKKFDYTYFFPTFMLNKIFENFNETELFKEIIKNKTAGFSLLDIGCAAGEFYRYFIRRYPNCEYRGYDISEKAIKRAKKKFPKG